ncbi:MAG: serine hydrolase [Acidobacteriota bacterium]|nr:serine hydrolase [Acidobacteriota bacterium]
MKRILALTVFVGGLLAGGFPAAEEAPLRLERGSPPIEREVEAGETHTYEIRLKAKRFLYLVVEQRGIDVVVGVDDPDGEPIGVFDSPNGTRGPEHVTVSGEKAGVYRITVEPLLEDAERGGYTLEVKTVEPLAKKPEGKIDQLFAQWDRPDAPGFSLAVSRDGETVLERGYGSAQLEYGVPITPSTIFHVASVSKQFTAFAVAMLADRGELSLDDDIRKHIPEVPDFGETITLRHLIHHTSGLRDQWNLLALGGWRLDDVITTEQILTAVRYQEDLNFEPGEMYLYCNTGYTLLGEVVARVTGQSFPEWTAENLFEPLDMNDTHFHDDHEMIVPNRAYSYARDGSGYRKSVLSYANAGATSLFTTVGDLLKWTHNLETGEVGGEAVVAQMHERGVLNSGEELDYAFGLIHGRHGGLATVEHGGGDAGFRTVIVRYPEQGLAVAAFGNLGGFNPSRIARQVAAIFLEEELETARAEVRAAESPDEAAEEVAEEVEVNAATLDDYAGEFQLESGLVVTLEREGEQLTGRPRGQPPVRLIAESEDTFRVEDTGARVTFHRSDSGEVDRFTLFQSGQEVGATRVEPFDPGEERLVEYVGEYYSPELGTFYEVAVEDEKLVALHRRHGTIGLDPAVTDEFLGNRWFFGRAKFVRDDEGRVVAMLVSSGRVRDVRFTRR